MATFGTAARFMKKARRLYSPSRVKAAAMRSQAGQRAMGEANKIKSMYRSKKWQSANPKKYKAMKTTIGVGKKTGKFMKKHPYSSAAIAGAGGYAAGKRKARPGSQSF